MKRDWQQKYPNAAQALIFSADAVIQQFQEKPIDFFLAEVLSDGIYKTQLDPIIAKNVNKKAYKTQGMFEHLVGLVDVYHRTYRRMECLKVLADSDIKMTIYTDRPSVLSDFLGQKHCCDIRPPIKFEEFLGLMPEAKICLSTTYANGLGSFPERIPSAMRNGAVSISPESSHLNDYFTPNEAISFRQTEIAQLPNRIHTLLQDYQQMDSVAEAGTKKVEAGHTPRHRALQLINGVNQFIAEHGLQ